MNPRIEKILKLPFYQRILILATVVALIAGGFVYLVFLPQQEELARLQSRKEVLEKKVQEDRRIAADLGKFKAEYEKMKEQLDLALTELPNEREIPTLLTSIASIAKDNGLEVLRFKPGPEQSKGFYAEVPVELKLVGSFHEVAMFFFAVGDLPRIVNISRVNIGGAKVVDGRASLTIDCLATTFRFVEEPPKPPPAQTPARGRR
jgi:type IV pilus assembly protein PilO